MQTLIIQTEGKKFDALIAILKALDISFKSNEPAYDPEFITKIQESKEDKKAGRTRKITLDDIWKSN
jgi:hypothetical protein